ncbi:hypothetical protein [Helicobacter sp. MIT 14-3879]|uniref:hypothetical protein n=1 Tax=Helicobacter sp. MIT 14-3879 TaxID=2040649 RepID=UPI000E1F245F|nr:hypothetical protein [Helicobacter sp. MIT 14-3879]RDU62209.1 hypothetical protein CQA44_07370 [Helicobacter sp. MIT 14-3879]
MKKKAITSTVLGLALACSAANAQEGGAFVGLFGGVGLNTTHSAASVSNNAGSSSGFSTETVFNLIYGAKLGYILAMNQNNAFRIYGDFTAGDFRSNDRSYYLMTAGGGIDYLLSFSKFGIFLGAGYGYAFGQFINALEDARPHQVYANVGFAWNISKLQLELGAKIPFFKYAEQNMTLNAGGTNISGTFYVRTTAQIYFGANVVF